MAVAETAHEHHEHHEHGEFIAHHFDTPEQQFDSGKLGIWVFLVTEVLFFSGLFVAYTLWRFHHPEIYEQAHVHLDKYLGALNTIVLLFSSLTIAWGVRSAQLGNNRNVAILTLITMVCAAMFIGVKAVEYSHKWDQGILVRSAFTYTPGHDHHASATMPMAVSLGISDWLLKLSIVPTILLLGFVLASVVTALMQKSLAAKFFAGMAITIGGYFLGAVGGHFYMEATGGGAGGKHAQFQSSAPIVLHADEKAKQADGGHADQGHDSPSHMSAAPLEGQISPQEKQDRDIGIFFSIYYCMTGLHAIHIIGGIAALAWIFYRSLAGHWRPDYFGPVDYVGLYWHLVDLIWIYLFPMLYLID
ncbi:MAG: cytochrome c oxidase subunit 3 [Pirellulaceae bacterium]